MKPLLVKNSRLARWLNVNGIVLWPCIFFAPHTPDPFLLNHELIHWDQISRHGVLKFYVRYLLEYWRGRRSGLSHHEAYLAISYEREAYENEKDLTYLHRLA